MSGDGTPAARGQATPSTTSTVPATTTTGLARATSPACPAIPARARPDPARPKYTLRADVRPSDGSIDGQLRVIFTPDVDTDRLVFRLWPNGPPASPTPPELTAGDVTIAFQNKSSIPHDVTVTGDGDKKLGATEQITGSSAKLDLKAVKAGKYTFFCSVPGHEQAGMKGTLTVR